METKKDSVALTKKMTAIGERIRRLLHWADLSRQSTAVCTTRRMLDHLGLEGVVPNASALLSGRFPVSSMGATK